MSSIAAQTLADLGYTNLYHLDGGFAAWEGAGLHIEQTPLSTGLVLFQNIVTQSMRF
jgi:3-mercaptopyruvate sulfurtransferase SseA